ncbi:hypothetical protein MIND_00331100 [Mycena indigotica]|uniref:Uncharacterized protein n=1 Tax=Mycena indigotica TaxID=2126181 RepID=A0A8H6WAW9_9AGAR|nr:uncharacterized protein MIND_00331100 [Mycena indigotica]KAF7309601.1 hypothetical protein MIND_00331100 [Mycena indigotica]
MTTPNIDDLLLHLGDSPDNESVEAVTPRTLDVCGGTAFRLVLLLQLRKYKSRKKPTVDDAWTNWMESIATSGQIQQLELQIVDSFNDFLYEHRTTQDIHTVLWTSFPISDNSSRRLRVVDFLMDGDCPPTLLSHDVVMFSLEHLWRYGNASVEVPARYQAFCTPRVLHLVDLSAHLFYFGLLVSYVMHPPYEPTIFHVDGQLQRTGWREILLVILSASILCRSWNWSNIPTFILFSVFMLHLPTVPFAGGLGFDVLLFCFACHAFQFHFPAAPSPLLLFKRSLPFATFLARGFYHIIIPFILFFLPIFLLITTWLSIALSETFLSPSSMIPTPIQTRTTVLYLFFALVSVISCALFILVVRGGSLADTRGWDGYSAPIGHNARASFVKAVVAYASPHTFPAPFSLLQMIFIRIPSSLMRRQPAPQAEKLLWQLTVFPISMPLAIFFLVFPDQWLG